MLTDIKTILYATDLHDESEAGLLMAMSLAEKYQAKVTYLHVVEPINISVYGWGAMDDWIDIEKETLNRSKATAEQQLNDFCDNELSAYDTVTRPSVKVLRGHVAQSILDCAESINVDLIVMGARSHGVISELLLGSVADKVLRLSKRPVLLMPI